MARLHIKVSQALFDEAGKNSPACPLGMALLDAGVNDPVAGTAHFAATKAKGYTLRGLTLETLEDAIRLALECAEACGVHFEIRKDGQPFLTVLPLPQGVSRG